MSKKMNIAFAALVLSGTFAYGQNTLNLKAGDKFEIQTNIETYSVSEMQGQRMEVNGLNKATYLVEVKEVNDDKYVLESTIKHMSIKMGQLGQEMKYDSDSPNGGDATIGTSLKEIMKDAKKIEMNNKGELLYVQTSGNDALAMFEEDIAGVAYGAVLAFQVLPDDLTVGKSWTKSNDKNDSKNTNSYTINSIDGDIATVGVNATIDNEKTINRMGMEIFNKTKGTLNGEIKMNKKTFIVQSAKNIVNTEGSSTLMGQTIPSTTKTTSTITIKEIK